MYDAELIEDLRKQVEFACTQNDADFLNSLEAKVTAEHLLDNRSHIAKQVTDRLLVMLGGEPDQGDFEYCSYESHRIMAYIIRARRLRIEAVRARVFPTNPQS